VLVFGNTTQAVSAILTGFFGGMAIGSAFGGRIADRVRRPLRLYGILELVLVLVVVATPITFRLLHEVYRGAFGWLEGQPGLLTLDGPKARVRLEKAVRTDASDGGPQSVDLAVIEDRLLTDTGRVAP